MQVIKSLTSKYDGENLTGNGTVVEHGGQRFVYQHFDLGMRLTTVDGWQLSYARRPGEALIVWRMEGKYPGWTEIRREATTAEIEIAEMAHSGKLALFVAAQPSDDIVDRTPWQKGDHQPE